MDNNIFKQEIIAAGKRMLRGNLTVETWGNVSRLDRAAGSMYITPSGMDYETVTEADIVVISLETGEKLSGERRPSIETGLHRAIYLARNDISAVLHTHPIYSTVFACMGEDIPVLHDEAAQALGETVRLAAYALPGSAELAKNCVTALGETANACLLQSHGAVCVGKDFAGCFKVAAVLEMVAHVYHLIRAAGGSYVPISDENIAFMRHFAATGYGQV